MSLAPGDMAVIVSFNPKDPYPELNGLTVTVVRECVCVNCVRQVKENPQCIRPWRCSGLPGHVHAVAEPRLRKIPPAPMVEDESETMEMVT